jgi:hypothetical protein
LPLQTPGPDTDTQTHRHTDTQTHRHTDTQTHRHTDTQTHARDDDADRWRVIAVAVRETRANTEDFPAFHPADERAHAAGVASLALLVSRHNGLGIVKRLDLEARVAAAMVIDALSLPQHWNTLNVRFGWAYHV